jgi:hypothetical protein
MDNCMSPYHAKGIQGFAEKQGVEVVHLRERFKSDTTDAEWIAKLGADGGWIIVSGDARITRSNIEREAWHESGLTAFFFSEPWPSDNYWKQAAALVPWWPRIMQQAERTPKGHGFIMPKLGSNLSQVYPRLPRGRG